MGSDSRDVWDDVAVAAANSIRGSAISAEEQDVLTAVVIGAADAIRAVRRVHSDYFAALEFVGWDAALAALDVATASMISRFVHHLVERELNVDGDALWARLTGISLQVFESFGSDREDECRFMDAQFEHGHRIDIDAGLGIFAQAIEELCLVCLIARSLGGNVRFAVKSDTAPADSLSDLLASILAPPPGLNITDIGLTVMLHDELMASEFGMYAAYRSLRAARTVT